MLAIDSAKLKTPTTLILVLATLLTIIGAIVADEPTESNWYLTMSVMTPVLVLAGYVLGMPSLVVIAAGSTYVLFPHGTDRADGGNDDQETGWALILIGLILSWADPEYIQGKLNLGSFMSQLPTLGIFGLAFVASCILWSQDGQVEDGSQLLVWACFFFVSQFAKSSWATIITFFVGGFVQYGLLSGPIEGDDDTTTDLGATLGWIAVVLGLAWILFNAAGAGTEAAVASLKGAFPGLPLIVLVGGLVLAIIGAVMVDGDSADWISANSVFLQVFMIWALVETGERQQLLYTLSFSLSVVVNSLSWVFADTANEAEDETQETGFVLHLIASWLCWVSVLPIDKFKTALLGLGCIKGLLPIVALAAHVVNIVGVVLIFAYVGEADFSFVLLFAVFSIFSSAITFTQQHLVPSIQAVGVLALFFITYSQIQLFTQFLTFNELGSTGSKILEEKETYEAGTILCWAAHMVFTVISVIVLNGAGGDEAPANSGNDGTAGGNDGTATDENRVAPA